MPRHARTADESAVHEFSVYDMVSATPRSIAKNAPRMRKQQSPPQPLPPPVTGNIPARMTMRATSRILSDMYDDPEVRRTDFRRMGTFETEGAMKSINAMPWYALITNERVRKQFENMARDEFVCDECGASVVELENIGRWQCKIPVSWVSMGNNAGVQYQSVKFMVRADHRRPGAPTWNNALVSTVEVTSSVMAVMDNTAAPLPEAIMDIQCAKDGACEEDMRMTEQFVRDSRIIVRYSAAAIRVVTAILEFHDYLTDHEERSSSIRKALHRSFDMSRIHNRPSRRDATSKMPLYILKKQTLSK